MHRTLLIVAAAVICASAHTASANLLINGNLDLPGVHESDVAIGWTLQEPDLNTAGAPVNSATFASFANHTPGGAVGLWYRSFEGNLTDTSPETVNAHLFQTVPVTPGLEYFLTAWYFMEANYSGLNPAAPTQTILALEFLDGGSTVLAGSLFLDIDTVYDTNATSTWQQFALNGIAPAGAVNARVRSSMTDGVFQPTNPQSAFVDDFVLTGIPEPTTANLALLAAAGLTLTRHRPRNRPSRT